MDVPPTPVRVTGVPSVSVSPRELARDEGAREYVAPVSKRAVVAKFAEFPGLTYSTETIGSTSPAGPVVRALQYCPVVPPEDGGGAVAVTVISLEALAVAPAESVTVSVTVKVPAEE